MCALLSVLTEKLLRTLRLVQCESEQQHCSHEVFTTLQYVYEHASRPIF
jgi:hypothetical protein